VHRPLIKLSILLHEEGHWLDNQKGHKFWREYRAQKYLMEKALALNCKALIRDTTMDTKYWLTMRNHPRWNAYYCAANRLVKTKLWRQLCQN
ncbi:hypothetical protein LCGC14_2386660, partial [marine sediment metagenome]